MKIQLNPIVKKDVRVSTRSMRISWGLFVYEAVLVVAFLIALTVIQSTTNSIYDISNVYSALVYIFPILAGVQVVIVALIMPILTASSISGEKERQTFDIMLTTCMSPMSIVLGKVTSAVIRILFYVAASLPIMALSFVVGGMNWWNLFFFLLAITLLAIFAGSIGIFCSAVCNKSITAVILSFIFYGIICCVPVIPTFFSLVLGVYNNSGNIGEGLLPLLFNPVMFFIEFFVFMMTGETLMTSASFSTSDVGLLTYALTRESVVWLIVSAICMALMAAGFMLLAAWKVNPMHTRSPRVK